MSGSLNHPHKTRTNFSCNKKLVKHGGLAKRAASITEKLCHLYISITQDMDPSLIKYHLQSEKIQNLFTKCKKGH
jgi:hypothetical protein